MKKLLCLLCVTLLLAACGNRSPGKISAPTVSFPSKGVHLQADCAPFAPPEDDGSRRVSLHYTRMDGSETEGVYELKTSPTETKGPGLSIRRASEAGEGEGDFSPVTEKEDRALLLDLIRKADFRPAAELPERKDRTPNLYLKSDDGGKQQLYGIFPDGSVSRVNEDGSKDLASGAADYLQLSALEYKYAGSPRDGGGFPAEGWLALVKLQPRETIPKELAAVWGSCYPIPPDAHYRLCAQGEDFHKEMDRRQALVFLKTIFGQKDPDTPAVPVFKPAPADWTPPKNGIRLTESLKTVGTFYAGGGQELLEQVIWLYPDGTAARVPLTDPVYFYDLNEAERVTPSWKRVLLAEKSFDPEALAACLRGLGVTSDWISETD